MWDRVKRKGKWLHAQTPKRERAHDACLSVCLSSIHQPTHFPPRRPDIGVEADSPETLRVEPPHLCCRRLGRQRRVGVEHALYKYVCVIGLVGDLWMPKGRYIWEFHYKSSITDLELPRVLVHHRLDVRVVVQEEDGLHDARLLHARVDHQPQVLLRRPGEFCDGRLFGCALRVIRCTAILVAHPYPFCCSPGGAPCPSA